MRRWASRINTRSTEGLRVNKSGEEQNTERLVSVGLISNAKSGKNDEGWR